MRELLGQRDISHREVARLVGQAIGQPGLPYVQLSETEMGEALVGAGLSPSFVALYLEMTRAFNEERIAPREGRTAANTTPTPFEAFVPELAAAYRTM